MKGKEIGGNKGSSSQDPHFQNLTDAIRKGTKLNSDISDGQISTMMCHLGNIAYRTKTVLDVDSKTGKIRNNPDAMALWKREYRPGMEPKV